MLSYEIEPAVLAPWVPAGTTLDAWRDRTYVSIVGLRFVDTRLLGVPVPFHRHFEEVNLRFYVRRVVAGEVRRAVVFIRELVPRRAIAALARRLYNEPYRAVPMRSAVTGDGAPAVEYGWQLERGGRWHTLAARGQGSAAPAAAPRGSLEEFITEHDWGYNRRADGATIEYRVAHARWRVWAARDVRVDADLAALYGAELARWLGRPASALIADGSAVKVGWPRRCDA